MHCKLVLGWLMAALDDVDQHIVGTCRLMCPATEIQMRETHGLLHRFEILPGTSGEKRPPVDRTKVVKEYTRPAAGKYDPQPSDLRPGDVLMRTTNYLINRILPKEDCSWSCVYEYVFDRLRAVRQDLVVQRLGGQLAINILERSVRFLVYSTYRLCTSPLAEFDPKLNDNHVQECLKRLLHLYAESACHQQNEAEFVSLYLLYNLGSVEALMFGLQNKQKLRGNVTFRKALAISLAVLCGNFVRVFRFAQQLSAVQLCAFHRHVAGLHTQALRTMSAGFHSKSLKFPVSTLADILVMDEPRDAATLCSTCGLEVAGSGVVFNKTAFTEPDKLHPRHWDFIEEKVQKKRIPGLIHGDDSDTELTDSIQHHCSLR